MKKLGEALTKHRNAFLLALLSVTLIVSSHAARKRNMAAPAVSIPVAEVSSVQLSPLEAYRQQRDTDALADIATLEKLIAQPLLDDALRESAAVQLQQIIDQRQAQSALEGSLTGSSLYPCAAVVSDGCLTIVTEKATITDKDSTLVMTLAVAHAGIPPENVHIITTK